MYIEELGCPTECINVNNTKWVGEGGEGGEGGQE